MKKVLPVLILLAFIAFCYRFIETFFITEHTINYSLISSDQRHYNISEEYRKKGNQHYYSFVIKNKKKEYVVSIEENLKKQDRIITDIKYYKKDNLECIFPIYKKNHTYDMSCLLDGEQVSSYYLVETKNDSFSAISKKFVEDGYDEIFYNYNLKPKKEGSLLVYYDYIPEGFIFTNWNYRGINIITSDGVKKELFLNDDHYENTLSVVAGKYYITVNTDNEEEQLNYYQLILYDLEEEKKSLVDMEISQDSYFNGVADGIVYITDPKEEKQYKLNPKNKKLEEVSKLKVISNFKIKNASKNFFDSPKVDDCRVSNQKITELYHTKDIQQDGDKFYFKTDDGKLYQVIQKNYEHPVLLCQFDDIKEWQVHDGGVAFVVDDVLYFYSDYYGLKPILINPELQYNFKNINHFIREE